MYESVIGLEVHIELATKTKIFCSCSTAFGGKINTQTCPVCTGMPGTLPVLNKKVVDYAIAVGLAMNCTITRYCKFDRKNYFYPDNPQNYQISQLYMPICKNGKIDISNKSIGIHEIHMEEDAGKLIHDDKNDVSLIDYNRSGIPLIEIVSMPDMRNADEVIECLEKLRIIMQYLEVSDCKLNEGSMRVDVNISVRKKGSDVLGTRTEMKNLNSFKAIKRAIENEKSRQIEIIENGNIVMQETRRWDDNKECSYSMRSKEDAKDYRYFPEPDLMPLFINDEWINNIRNMQPEFKDAKKERYIKKYSLSEYDANILTDNKKLADLFEKTLEFYNKPKLISNWLLGETMRLLNENNMIIDNVKFSPENLSKLVELVDKKVVTMPIAKEIFEKVFLENINPNDYVEKKGLQVIDDVNELDNVICEIIEQNEKSVQDYKAGKKKAIGFLIGQTMKKMKGRANPQIVNKLLEEKLTNLK